MTRLSLLVLALALTACNDKNPDDSGGDDSNSGQMTDADGDNFFAEEDDCDDENASINPAATEQCNGYDDNCDGLVDDSSSADALTWYPDADSDNYGDMESAGTAACSKPEGYVSDNTDCNDDSSAFHPAAPEEDCTDPSDYNCDGSVGYEDNDGDGYAACDECNDDNNAINPGAGELCDNALDDDCDTQIDEDDASDAPTWYLDSDEDGFGRPDEEYSRTSCDQPFGYVDDNTDCDDLNPDAYPDADEYCDGEDNDCRGDIDENDAIDADTWYYDGDADNFGDPGVIQIACYQPTNYLSDNNDCDDSDAAVNPAADEYCVTAGVDDDCDSNIDENTAVDAPLWYRDSDNDDYGIDATTVYSCSEPSNYAAGSGDCDDTDDTVNPGVDEECDSIDNDCNGVVDDTYAVDADIWYLDSDGDNYGDPDLTTPSCTDPADYVGNDEDCDDSTADVNPGVAEVCNDGIDNDCDGGGSFCELDLGSSADTVFLGEDTNHGAGNSVAAMGDMDGDGLSEIAISANNATFDGASLGAVYFYFGALGAEGTVSLSDADAVVKGAVSGDKAGKTVSGGFDIDGDGLTDYAIASAAPSEICNDEGDCETGATESGAAWLFYGTPSGEMDVTAADAAFIGGNSYDRAGVATLLGDVDGDGYADVAVGANADDTSASNSGAIYLVYGPAYGLYDLDASIGDKLTGEASSDKAGQELAAPGDVNGDGLADLLSSTIQPDSTTGVAYVNFGPITGTASLGSADVRLTGEDAGDAAGNSIGAAGDVNGDGYDDYMVGATGEDEGASGAGAVYLIYGPGTSGDLSVASIKFIGAVTDNGLGTAADGTGDINGDGEADIALGASGAGSSNGGESYLMFGPFSAGTYSVGDADAMFMGDESGDAVGGVLSFTGDIDGSGHSALLFGAEGDEEAGVDAGAAYLVLEIGL